jgi:hypothetical protein
MPPGQHDVDFAVIGAGPAGLAAAKALLVALPGCSVKVGSGDQCSCASLELACWRATSASWICPLQRATHILWLCASWTLGICVQLVAVAVARTYHGADVSHGHHDGMALLDACHAHRSSRQRHASKPREQAYWLTSMAGGPCTRSTMTPPTSEAQVMAAVSAGHAGGAGGTDGQRLRDVVVGVQVCRSPCSQHIHAAAHSTGMQCSKVDPCSSLGRLLVPQTSCTPAWRPHQWQQGSTTCLPEHQHARAHTTYTCVCGPWSIRQAARAWRASIRRRLLRRTGPQAAVRHPLRP